MEQYGVQQLNLDTNDDRITSKMRGVFKEGEIMEMRETPLSKLQISTSGMIESGISNGKLVGRLDKQKQKIYNDYRGLAELSGIGPHEISAFKSPAYDTLREMEERQFTVFDLVTCLLCIGRSELVKNIRANLLHDCRICAKQQQEYLQLLALNEEVMDDDYSSKNEDKVWLFDAFLSSTESDSRYARHVLEQLEKKGFKIYYPDRDLIPGQTTHSVNAFFIEERCKYIIIILSQAFSRSPENSFHLKFSKALDPASKDRKIIPIKFEENAPMPRTLNYVNLCDMTKENGWTKLCQALQSVHRINKKVLEELKYPQRHPVDVKTTKIDHEQVLNDKIGMLDTIGTMPDSLPTRHQPDGQEPVSRPKTDRHKSIAKPSLYRSKSCLVGCSRSGLHETTV